MRAVEPLQRSCHGAELSTLLARAARSARRQQAAPGVAAKPHPSCSRAGSARYFSSSNTFPAPNTALLASELRSAWTRSTQKATASLGVVATMAVVLPEPVGYVFGFMLALPSAAPCPPSMSNTDEPHPESNAMPAPRPAAANSGSRVSVVALLAIAVLLFSEQRALAGEEAELGREFYLIIGGSAAGAASVPFLVADVAYTVQHRWLPPGWAIPQIAIGGGVNAAVAILGMSMYSQDTCLGTSAGSSSAGAPLAPRPNVCGELLPVAIGAAVLSVGFIAHGVASLVLYEPAPATKASGRVGLKPHSAYLRWVPRCRGHARPLHGCRVPRCVLTPRSAPGVDDGEVALAVGAARRPGGVADEARASGRRARTTARRDRQTFVAVR